MANSINRESIESLQIQDYERLVRPTLRSGYLFFCSGNHWISNLIRKFTNSAWSHVGIIVKFSNPDRVMALESVEDKGVHMVPFSKYLSYNGLVCIANFSLPEFDIDKAISRGLNLLGKSYDKNEILKIVARIVAGEGRLDGDDEYICSELIYECFKESGYLIGTDPRGFVSPENIWQDPYVSMIGRIR